MLRGSVNISSRFIFATSVRCNSMVYEPYAGVELASTFSPPLLGELPEEYQNVDTPENFSLLNFKVSVHHFTMIYLLWEPSRNLL